MVRVLPDEVLTGTQCLDALVEVIEGHGEMSRVASAERVAADDRGIELTAADDDDLVPAGHHHVGHGAASPLPL
jgi:hypothetical protein